MVLAKYLVPIFGYLDSLGVVGLFRWNVTSIVNLCVHVCVFVYMCILVYLYMCISV